MTDLIKPNRFYGLGVQGQLNNLIIGMERAKYGISESDIVNMHDYLFIVISNGLRLMADKGHGWPGTEEFPTYDDWAKELHAIADKLTQAATVGIQISAMYEEIDWSEDDREPLGLEDDFSGWLNKSTSTPAFKEYSRRTDEIEKLAEKNAKEALEWLAKYWQALWD